jgi:hypothetical protein
MEWMLLATSPVVAIAARPTGVMAAAAETNRRHALCIR